jgi:hypothetical protein
MRLFRDITSGINLSFLIGIVLLLLYSIAYIFINSYEINDTQYFALFDDPMVSMRYAENIANGDGPVWNPGEEAVEGFSNPLWVYMMAIIHLFPIAKTHTSFVVQILAVFILLLNLYFVKRSTEMLSGNNPIVTSVSVITTALYLPLLNWSLQGLETSIITLLISWSFFINLRNIGNNNYSLSQLIIPAITVFVRMDSILIYLVFFVFLYFFDNSRRRIILRSGLLILLITLIIIFVWRYIYYSEWLPNTYYLKMTGYPVIYRIGKGLYAFTKFVLYMTPVIFILPFWFYSKAKKSFLILPVAIISIMILYSIYIGGDSWEWWMPANRFIAQTMPLFIIMTSLATMYLSALLNRKFKNLNRIMIFSVFSVIILIGLNFNSWEYLKGELLLESTFTRKDNINNTVLALGAKEISRKDAVAAVAMAGTLPYFLERNCIDLLGKNDKTVAKMPVQRDTNMTFLQYNPGHMKYNYAYSIGRFKPDIVLQLWYNPVLAMPYLSEDYYSYELEGFNVFLKKYSDYILWDETEGLF